MPNLTIDIASTRRGGARLPIATWFAERARAHGGFDVSVVRFLCADASSYITGQIFAVNGGQDM